ncbi:hypothetical protein PHET_01634 [Paragonimus heterotremus]|uniref:Uncharacterized protein n=1 Tax=Paragonimus heterotremus TaxID=100268 RepID=A0A8J4WUI3_9TREM|nr:hypothetical protein PHET_01634 [Paragonimus heterotremus]
MTNMAEEDEVIDIDLKDPEVEKAALKIQAHFKGFKCNKKSTATNLSNPDSSIVETPDSPNLMLFEQMRCFYVII